MPAIPPTSMLIVREIEAFYALYSPVTYIIQDTLLVCFASSFSPCLSLTLSSPSLPLSLSPSLPYPFFSLSPSLPYPREKSENFQRQLKRLEEEANQTLQSLVTAPMQRVTKLPLLMSEILKRTPNDDPRQEQMELTHRATAEVKGNVAVYIRAKFKNFTKNGNLIACILALGPCCLCLSLVTFLNVALSP